MAGDPRYELRRWWLGGFTCWDGMLSMTVRVFRETAFEV
jgi:hypothetical protein